MGEGGSCDEAQVSGRGELAGGGGGDRDGDGDGDGEARCDGDNDDGDDGGGGGGGGGPGAADGLGSLSSEGRRHARRRARVCRTLGG